MIPEFSCSFLYDINWNILWHLYINWRRHVSYKCLCNSVLWYHIMMLWSYYFQIVRLLDRWRGKNCNWWLYLQEFLIPFQLAIFWEKLVSHARYFCFNFCFLIAIFFFNLSSFFLINRKWEATIWRWYLNFPSQLPIINLQTHLQQEHHLK